MSLLHTRGYGQSSGGSGEEPSLANPLPASGTTLEGDRRIAKLTPISFEVLNPGEQRWSIWVKFRNDERGYVVYDSTVGFLPPFDTEQSTFVALTGRLTILQACGWQDDIEMISLGGQGDALIIPVRPGGPGSNNPPHAPEV